MEKVCSSRESTISSCSDKDGTAAPTASRACSSVIPPTETPPTETPWGIVASVAAVGAGSVGRGGGVVTLSYVSGASGWFCDGRNSTASARTRSRAISRHPMRMHFLCVAALVFRRFAGLS